MVDRLCFGGHNGGEDGVSTDMYLDPINNIGICVLTNGEGNAIYICDELYDYALSLNPVASIIPECGGTNSIDTLTSENAEIVKIVDFIGREIDFQTNVPCIILYSDGSTERLMQVGQ